MWSGVDQSSWFLQLNIKYELNIEIAEMFSLNLFSLISFGQ